MAAWVWLCIALFLLLALNMMPVGIETKFSGSDLRLRLRIGFLRFSLKLQGRQEKEKKPEKTQEGTEGGKRKSTKKKSAKRKLSAEEIVSLVQTLLSALGGALRRLCRRIRICPMELSVIFGGAAPDVTARSYGYASAAMYAVMPRLEAIFHVPGPKLHLDADFTAERTSVMGEIGISARMGALLLILLRLLLPLLRWMLRRNRDTVTTDNSDSTAL